MDCLIDGTALEVYKSVMDAGFIICGQLQHVTVQIRKDRSREAVVSFRPPLPATSRYPESPEGEARSTVDKQ